MSACKYGDPCCPCQDGDTCHYEGKNPMRPPVMTEDALPRIYFLTREQAIAKIRELEGNVRKLIELKLDYQASIEELRNKHDAETIRWREFNQMTLARVEAAEALVATLEKQFAERAEAFEHSMQAARQQLSAAQERAKGLEALLFGGIYHALHSYSYGDDAPVLADEMLQAIDAMKEQG